MVSLGVEALAAKICQVVSQTNVVLFAGAGVGKRVGLPDWDEYVEHLAAESERYTDGAASVLIRERLRAGAHAAAASVYKTSVTIPEGRMWEGLASPFRISIPAEELGRLDSLVGLGFGAIVTTNYDRSLLNAFAKVFRYSPIPLERGDGSLKRAPVTADVFIARVHGRAEDPPSMVVDVSDYRALENDAAYLDFLIDLFKQKPCLFVGFSFLDPAISHVLTVFEQKLRPHYPQLHTALLPEGAESLAERLRQLNIETVFYDPADGHAALWRAIRACFQSRGAQLDLPYKFVEPPRPTSTTHRFLAFAYAQLLTRTSNLPLVQIVQDGVVLSVLDQAPKGIRTIEELGEQTRVALSLSPKEAGEIVAGSLDRLAVRGELRIDDQRVTRTSQPSHALEEHLSTLADGVLNRMRVRENVKVARTDKDASIALLELLFVARAWDLAAHFAGAASGWSADLRKVVARMVVEIGKQFPISGPGALERAVLDLLSAPEDPESKLLAELGRAAFGVQLVVATPRQALFQQHALPQRVYLDANVLLRTITEGHPLRPVYLDVFDRLTAASKQVGAQLKVLVGTQFLDEVVRHRKEAVGIVRDLHLETPENLQKLLLYYSATTVNVFLGAYASFVGREQKRVSFNQFLSQAAPYTSRDTLAGYLEKRGIETTGLSDEEMKGTQFTEVFGRLLEGYENAAQWRGRNKRKVLVRHEAEQLAQIRLDTYSGHRSIFVTADNFLRRILQQDSRFVDLSGSTVSHLGLVALVDVMVGLDPDSRSFARMLWANARQTDERGALMDYFIRLALKQYDAALAMEMQHVAARVAGQVLEQAKVDKIHLLGHDIRDVSQTARLLDRYEDAFFANMREAIEKREARGTSD
jgi:uncharacterized short protein YbdD (DUF466 family)